MGTARTTSWVALLLLGVGAVCASGDDAPPRKAAPGRGEVGLPGPLGPWGFGVNIHFTDPMPREMERFAEAGFGLARMDFKWDLVERSAGTYDFSPYDRLVEHLAQVGARPLFILDYGHPRHEEGKGPTSEMSRAAFARFAAAAAKHFHGREVVWEIWNEPNLAQFWRPEPSPAAYAALALETARAIRAADPEAVIVAPGSSQFPWEFFEVVFRTGLLEVIDAVSVHPYREGPPESVAADYGRLRALIARYAPRTRRGLPIVASEWGYSTAQGGVTESKQAQYLTRLWLTNLASGVNLSIFYDWRDDGDDPREREHRFGTVRRDLTPKPSFTAAKALIAALNGYSFRHRLASTGASPDWQLLFQRGDTDDLLVVSWMADPRAPDEAQTPRVRRVDRGEPDFTGLRRLALIRYAAGPRAEGTGEPASLAVALCNPDAMPARIGVTVGEGKAPAIDAKLVGGRRQARKIAIVSASLRAPNRAVPIRLTWDGQALPAVVPLDMWQTDPITIGAAPRDTDLEVSIEGLGRSPWSGRVVVTSDGREVSSAAVTLADAARRTSVRVPVPQGWHEVSLVDLHGALVARQDRRRYEAPPGFPAKAGPAAGFSSVLYVENAPRPAEPMAAVEAPAGSPAAVALNFGYHFDRGWRYAEVRPAGLGPIPAGARALTLWLRGDTEKDIVRARFRDATGQTFQVDLGTTDGPAWRPLVIALDGSGAGSHWGGAGDGVPHQPLSWDGLVLVDSARRDVPHGGELLLAAPRYVFGD